MKSNAKLMNTCDAPVQAAGQDGAPLGLRALLEMLPALREAVEGGQAHTVVTHEVGACPHACPRACPAWQPAHILKMQRADALLQATQSLPQQRLAPAPHCRRNRFPHPPPLPYLTPQEHPLLGRPFLMLHPCQTDSVMALLMGQGQQGPADVEHAELAGHANGATGQLDLPAAASQQRCGGGQPEVGDSGERPSMLRYLAAWLSVVAQPLELRLPPARWARLLAA